MCHHLIRIPNPKRAYCVGLDRAFIYVPCGQCSECRDKMKKSWQVRICSEYFKFHANGSIWFPTLTYNNEHLPHFVDKSHNMEFPCFSPRHIQMFIKKLRHHFTRLGKDCRGMKFIVFSEFGGKHGRPHYHALLFLPFRINHLNMMIITKKAWTDSKHKPLGFVGVSLKGFEVNSLSACSYCAKYACKDMIYMTKYHIPEYLDILMNDIKRLYAQLAQVDKTVSSSDIETQIEFKKELLRSVRRVLPRHFQSMGFGLPILETFCHNGIFDLDEFMKGKYTIPGEEFTYNIPDYIKRKVFYDYYSQRHDGVLNHSTGELFSGDLGNAMFVLNDNGFKNSLRQFTDVQKSVFYDIAKFFDLRYLKTNGSYLGCSPDDIYLFLNQQLGNRNLLDLVNYKLVYQDMSFPCPLISLKCLRQYAPYYYTHRRLINRVPDYKSTVKLHPYILKDYSSSYNHLDIFSGFDEILDFIDELSARKSNLTSLANFKNDLDISYVSQFKSYLTL